MSVKSGANVSTVRATRSRPAPQSSTRSSGAGRATRRPPWSRRTRRNSPAFIRAVIDRTIENERFDHAIRGIELEDIEVRVTELERAFWTGDRGAVQHS